MSWHGKCPTCGSRCVAEFADSAGMRYHALPLLTSDERTAIAFIAHNDPKDGFVRRTWLDFKRALCGLLERDKASK